VIAAGYGRHNLQEEQMSRTDNWTDMRRRLVRYRTAQRKAVDFLLAHVNDDGSIGEPAAAAFYYRVPWTLAVVGESAAAMRSLTWMQQHMLTAEGEVAPAVVPPNWHRSANTYPEACVAFGAHLLRRYDLARRVMRFALRAQSPTTGGVYLSRTRQDDATPQMLYPTAQLGMAALLTGHEAAARAAGAWLVRLWQAQPELPGRLYTMWTDAGRLVTQPPAGADRRSYVQESQQATEYHYNGGIAAACLSYLYMATGEQQWLETARAYQQFSMRSTPRQFETKQVCKSSWGSALLWLITGEQQYCDWTLRMGDWFVAEQAEDGHWSNTPYLAPNPTLNDNLQITAEFVVHLDHIMGALSAIVTDDGSSVQHTGQQ